MKRLFTLLFAFFLPACFLAAQEGEPAAYDKNKVTDYFQNEQYTEAVQYLKSMESTAATDITFLNSLGYACYMLDQQPEATRYYQEALAIDSTNFTANRYMGLIKTNTKNYDEALFYYHRLIQKAPSYALLYKAIGDVYVREKLPDSALVNYATAYFLQPQNPKIVYSYADQLLDKELYPKADSILNEYLKNDTLNFSFIKLAIRSAYEQKAYDTAAAYTEKWKQSDILDIGTTKQLALANYYIKRYEDCLDICNTLLDQDLEIESLYYYAAKALYQLKNYQKSNELLQKSIHLAISNTADSYYAARAENFESLKQYKSAIAAYDTAYYLFKNPLTLYNIGRIYETYLHNNAVAKQYYKRYIKIAKPESEDEKEVYNYVKKILTPVKK